MEGTLTRPILRWPLERWMRLVACGIIGGMAIAQVVWTLQTWPMGDVEIYWEAGERIRDGEPLYPGDSPFRSYRYAPWFAWVWAGLTFLPYWVVAVAWETALLAACVAVTIPYLRHGWPGIALAAMLVPLLFAVSGGGNVQALLVVSLHYGLNRRSGPLWIALAASLRATPILFVMVYAARREWGRFWATLAITALLVAPMLLDNPQSLLTEVAGHEPGLLSMSPVLYLIVAVGAVMVVAVMAWRQSRYAAVAAAAAAVVASPKLFLYDATTMLAVSPSSTPDDARG
jgi:hypothetical protein